MPRKSNLHNHILRIVSKHFDRMLPDLAAAIRGEIADEIRKNAGTARGPAKTRRRTGKKRSMTCIAPGCTKRSKGPRFHFLCDQHVKAPKRLYTKWQQSARTK